MSDWYYDSKGIKHVTKQGADDASEIYLQEERNARQKIAEATEQIAQQADRQRQVMDQMARQQSEAESARLMELKKQGGRVRKDMDYQNRALFLKESDEPTRLDTLIELIRSKVDWDLNPGDDDDWESERKKTISFFYQLPLIPKECRPDGILTQKLKTLLADELNPIYTRLTEIALKVEAEKGKVEDEIKRLEASRGGVVTRLLGNIFSTPQTQTLQKRLGELVQRKNVLTTELEKHLSDARIQGKRKYDQAIQDCVELWMSTVRNAALKSFFDQHLWIEDEFPNRLKAALSEMQKPFPTSCRANVSNLAADQIERAYKILAMAVTDEIYSQMQRWNFIHKSPIFQSLYPEIDFHDYRPKSMSMSDIKSSLSKSKRYEEIKSMLIAKGVLISVLQDQEIGKISKRIIHDVIQSGMSNALYFRLHFLKLLRCRL